MRKIRALNAIVGIILILLGALSVGLTKDLTFFLFMLFPGIYCMLPHHNFCVLWMEEDK